MISVQIANSHILNLVAEDMREFGRKFSKNGAMRRPLERIRDEVMIPSIDTNFERGGRPKWEHLSPVTIMRRGGFSAGQAIEAAGTGSARPLDHTGRMRAAATAKARFHIRSNEMNYGNWPGSRWFGPVHDLPGLSSRAQIPNRPFVLIQPEDINHMGEILEEWIEEKAQESFRRAYI